MTTVSVCTTAPTLAETNLVLDTHINILPASPVTLRLQCTLQPCSSSPTHLPRHEPLISVNDGLLVLDEPSAALAERASLVAAAKMEGKLGVVLMQTGQVEGHAQRPDGRVPRELRRTCMTPPVRWCPRGRRMYQWWSLILCYVFAHMYVPCKYFSVVLWNARAPNCSQVGLWRVAVGLASRCFLSDAVLVLRSIPFPSTTIYYHLARATSMASAPPRPRVEL
jgi:hypothetical protein